MSHTALLSWVLLNLYFWTSLTLSMTKPTANMMMPTTSRPVPKPMKGYCLTAGELMSVTGRETTQTQIIWKTQKPRKGKNLSRLSSKRSSLPVLRMRNSRKPDSRTPHSMMKMEGTICRACGLGPDKARVIIARTTKLVPPAKSGVSC